MYLLEQLKHLSATSGPILVTGDSGFKGAWLVELFHTLGLETVGLSLSPEKGSLFESVRGNNPRQHFVVDIRDSRLLHQVIEKLRPSFIFHLAAQSIVSEGYRDPFLTYQTNVVGTINLIEAASLVIECRGIQVITTDKVYWNDNSGRAFCEDDKLLGHDPYSGSKVGVESVVVGLQKTMYEKYGLLIQSVRAGNVIGGGDLAKNRLLPDIVRSYMSGEPIRVRNPASTRPWQHVLDPLWGYLLSAENMLSTCNMESFNFGPVEESLSVSEVTEFVKKTWPQIRIELNEGQLEFREAEKLQISVQKAIRELNWHPNFSQYDSIQMTISWWEHVFARKMSPREAVRKDIEELLKKVSPGNA